MATRDSLKTFCCDSNTIQDEEGNEEQLHIPDSFVEDEINIFDRSVFCVCIYWISAFIYCSVFVIPPSSA